jgi:hypothetical protein
MFLKTNDFYHSSLYGDFSILFEKTQTRDKTALLNYYRFIVFAKKHCYELSKIRKYRLLQRWYSKAQHLIEKISQIQQYPFLLHKCMKKFNE